MQQQQHYVDLLIDALLDEGFTVEEARRLIKLQEEYEVRLATEETNYHRFARWLVEHGRLSDW
jgi:DNA-binding transcriptional MerR regulator